MHRIKIKFHPGTNKDGTPSKTNGVWIATDRTRGKTITVAEMTGKNTKVFREQIELAVEDYRVKIHQAHVESHPNDKHYQRKHSDKEKS